MIPGQAVPEGFYVVGMTSFAFFAEHEWNTWDRLRSSRGTSFEIVIGKAMPRLAVSCLQFTIIFAMGTLLFGLHSRGPLLALAPMVVAFATCLVPIDCLPQWARSIAPVTPSYRAMRGFRSVILTGDGLPALVLPIVVLLAMAAACVLVALARLRFAAHKVAY